MSTDPLVLAGTVRRQRFVIGLLAGSLALVLGLGASGPGGAAPEGPTFVAGGDRIYKIHSDRWIEYIEVDLANGSDEGIPGWARLHVDHALTRDRMGNEIRIPRR